MYLSLSTYPLAITLIYPLAHVLYLEHFPAGVLFGGLCLTISVMLHIVIESQNFKFFYKKSCFSASILNFEKNTLKRKIGRK